MEFIFDDGGRKLAGFKGKTGDCVVRALAIALEKPYLEIYDSMNLLGKDERVRNRKKSNSRTGVNRKSYEKYLKNLGWKFIPTMWIGTGCKVHMKENELPKGRIICRLSRHLVAVVDGVLHDTYDSSRDETRCVYGYYQKS